MESSVMAGSLRFEAASFAAFPGIARQGRTGFAPEGPKRAWRMARSAIAKPGRRWQIPGKAAGTALPAMKLLAHSTVPARSPVSGLQYFL
jgi:hypothetical protein